MRTNSLEIVRSNRARKCKKCGSAYLYRRDIDKVLTVLSVDAGKGYHNPADSEALELTTRALRYIFTNTQEFDMNKSVELTKQAIAAAEKAIGGQEDGE